MATISESHTTRNYINDRLDWVRRECPNLVTVIASLLPFRDVFSLTAIHPKQPAGDYILLEIINPNLPAEITVYALLDDEDVVIKEVNKTTHKVCEEYRGSISDFWNFLRSLPRGVSGFMD